MKKYIFAVILCAAVLAGISGCNARRDISLGFLGILTGKLGDLGISGRDGAVLAVELINENGGIEGRKIHLLIENNELDPQICREKASILIDQDIQGLIGPMTSDMSLACKELFDNARIVMISPTASTPLLSDQDDYFLRVNPSDESEGIELAKYAADVLNVQKIAVVYDTLNESFTYGVYSKFAEALMKIKEVSIKAYTFLSSDKIDFLDLSDSVLSGKPDAVFIVASALDTGTLCQRLRNKDAEVAIMATGWAMTEELIKQGGRAVDGVVFNHYHNNNSSVPAYKEFVAGFRHRFGSNPDFIAALSFNAVNVWAQAYSTRKKNQDVKARVIEIGIFNGLQGEVRINEYGDAFLERHYISVKDGVFIDL